MGLWGSKEAGEAPPAQPPRAELDRKPSGLIGVGRSKTRENAAVDEALKQKESEREIFGLFGKKDLNQSERDLQQKKEKEEQIRKEKERIQQELKLKAEKEYREKLLKAAIVFQKHWRGRKQRLLFKKKLNSIILLQSSIRSQIERKKFLQRIKAISGLQALWKGRKVYRDTQQKLKQVQQYKNIFFEIHATEKSYSDQLRLCCEHFLSPLLSGNPPMIPPETVKLIFLNIERIAKLHKKFSRDITIRANQWWPHQKIGDLFIKYLPKFGKENTYSEFVQNYNKSVQAYNRCLSEVPAFEQFLATQHKLPQLNLLGITDFLIMPVQRLPRYELLLADYLRKLPKDHRDYESVSKALTKLKSVTQLINERKKKSDSLQRLNEVSTKVRGGKNLDLVKPGRLLIREGLLTEVKKGKEKDVYIFLFSDMIMISKQKSVKKGLTRTTMRFDYQLEIPLENCIMNSDFHLPGVASPTKRGSLANSTAEFHFKITDKATNKDYIYKTPSILEKKGWTNDIESALKGLKQE